ncbi:hypothetical protein MMC30_004101 [Trapelia coarctata]|nr:hypothetical protein [Trapelia coarctata]
MRITTIALTTFVQLASLASAVPVSNEPESLAECPVPKRHVRHRCDNYPDVFLGVSVAKRDSSAETVEISNIEPRNHRHPNHHWCWKHSDMWLNFPQGKRHINETTVGDLFKTALKYTTAYIATDPQNVLFSNAMDEPIFLGSVYANPDNKDSITESMFALGANFTWKSLDSAVRILQNYVYVRNDHTNINATVMVGRKELGKLYLGGPMLPNGYYMPETTYTVSDHL